MLITTQLKAKLIFLDWFGNSYLLIPGQIIFFVNPSTFIWAWWKRQPDVDCRPVENISLVDVLVDVDQ